MVATLIQITAWVIRLDDVMADNNSPTAITFNSEHTINLLRWIACKKSILTKHSSEIRYLYAWWNDPVKRFDKGGIWKSKLAFHFVLHISYLLFSPHLFLFWYNQIRGNTKKDNGVCGINNTCFIYLNTDSQYNIHLHWYILAIEIV